MTETFAYFDCFSGASGDMILGAIVDAGLPLADLSGQLEKLPCGPIRLRAEAVTRCGIRATRVRVDVPREHAHRGLTEISRIISESSLSAGVKERSLRVFRRLAEAEAAVHGVPVEQVHFHEVGALDAIADIVGAAAGLELLGVKKVLFSTLRLGGGSIHAEHGELPVPAPATARLVTGLRCEMGPIEMELLTPTGAAILTTLGAQQDPPPFILGKAAYGAGGRDHPRHPNVLRMMLGTVAEGAEGDSVWILEANLDDATPQVCGYAIERLLAAGALDAWATPIQMKKSRPALMISALADESALGPVEETFFRETTTFGVRRYRADRRKLLREFRTVQTPYGPVRVKVGTLGGQIITASPEFEDCRKIAQEKGVALREVTRAATESFAKGTDAG